MVLVFLIIAVFCGIVTFVCKEKRKWGLMVLFAAGWIANIAAAVHLLVSGG